MSTGDDSFERRIERENPLTEAEQQTLAGKVVGLLDEEAADLLTYSDGGGTEIHFEHDYDLVIDEVHTKNEPDQAGQGTYIALQVFGESVITTKRVIIDSLGETNFLPPESDDGVMHGRTRHSDVEILELFFSSPGGFREIDRRDS